MLHSPSQSDLPDYFSRIYFVRPSFVYWEISPENDAEIYSHGRILCIFDFVLFCFVYDYGLWSEDFTAHFGEYKRRNSFMLYGCIRRYCLLSSSLSVHWIHCPGEQHFQCQISRNMFRVASLILWIFNIHVVMKWFLQLIYFTWWLATCRCQTD